MGSLGISVSHVSRCVQLLPIGGEDSWLSQAQDEAHSIEPVRIRHGFGGISKTTPLELPHTHFDGCKNIFSIWQIDVWQKNMGMLTISTVEFGEHPNPFKDPWNQPAGHPWRQMAAASSISSNFLVVEATPKSNIRIDLM